MRTSTVAFGLLTLALLGVAIWLKMDDRPGRGTAFHAGKAATELVDTVFATTKAGSKIIAARAPAQDLKAFAERIAREDPGLVAVRTATLRLSDILLGGIDETARHRVLFQAWRYRTGLDVNDNDWDRKQAQFTDQIEAEWSKKMRGRSAEAYAALDELIRAEDEVLRTRNPGYRALLGEFQVAYEQRKLDLQTKRIVGSIKRLQADGLVIVCDEAPDSDKNFPLVTGTVLVSGFNARLPPPERAQIDVLGIYAGEAKDGTRTIPSYEFMRNTMFGKP